MSGNPLRNSNIVLRALLLAALVASLAGLAGIPAVMAAGSGRHDTVGICHALGGGRYDFVQALETDFFGDLAGHGTHADDIVPPFTIDEPGNEDPASFAGQNWDDSGQQIYNHGCTSEPPAPLPPEPSKKVRICHATSSHSNPYVSEDPAIANNGDLHGGHLDHTGPVYPASGWGDIIPPYDYAPISFHYDGLNWTAEGQAIYNNDCNIPEPTPTPTPVPPTPTPTPVPPTPTPPPGATPTPTPTGGVGGATGTPAATRTLPSTSTIDSAASGPTGDGWRLVLLAMAGVLATALLLTPAGAVVRKDDDSRRA
jgi:hypothetical protein